MKKEKIGVARKEREGAAANGRIDGTFGTKTVYSGVPAVPPGARTRGESVTMCSRHGECVMG